MANVRTSNPIFCSGGGVCGRRNCVGGVKRHIPQTSHSVLTPAFAMTMKLPYLDNIICLKHPKCNGQARNQEAAQRFV